MARSNKTIIEADHSGGRLTNREKAIEALHKIKAHENKLKKKGYRETLIKVDDKTYKSVMLKRDDS